MSWTFKTLRFVDNPYDPHEPKAEWFTPVDKRFATISDAASAAAQFMREKAQQGHMVVVSLEPVLRHLFPCGHDENQLSVSTAAELFCGECKTPVEKLPCGHPRFTEGDDSTGLITRCLNCKMEWA